ncbi:MAG TPA: tetratricopeptide repeat protein [Gemmataceae bacterium]|nr:tetratricopeptide repeat protein [Gemmataceae bacterium]
MANCADLKFRDPAAAVTHARKATELAPKDGSAWSMLGTALYRAGQWREARDTLE